MALLEAHQVTKRFGSLLAVNRVDVRIEPGTIHAIIGPNGAGKTTLFNCVTGLYAPDEGTIAVKGRPLDGVKAHQRAALGMSRLLKFIGLSHRRDAPATTIPFGEQRRLEVARALATDPDLLLLDEPTSGMNPRETDEIDELIKQIQALGKTILLIEHDMSVVMKISDVITVLNFGEKIAEGPAPEIQKNPRVIEAYLGTED